MAAPLLAFRLRLKALRSAAIPGESFVTLSTSPALRISRVLKNQTPPSSRDLFGA